MTRRLLHFCIYSVLGLLVAVLVLIAWLAARLAEGPLPLPFLVPVVDRALNHLASPYSFTAANLVLAWRGWDEGADLSLIGLAVQAPEHAQPFLGVPELVLTLSSQALRARTLALDEVKARGVELRLERGADGRIALGPPSGSQEETDPFFRRLFAEIQAPPDPDRPASYLERVALTNASLELVDRPSGLVWRAAIGNASLARWGQDIRLAADLGVELPAGEARLNIDGTAYGISGEVGIALEFAQLHLADLAPMAPELAPLSALDLPLQGRTTIRIAADGKLQHLAFDLASGPGELIVSEALAAQLGDTGLAQRLGVVKAELRGSLSPQQQSLTVETLAVEFAKDATVLVPAPLNHRFPVRSLNASLRKEADRLELTSLALDLVGPKITGQAAVDGLAAAPSGSAQIAVANLRADEIRRYWPPSVAPGGLAWCADHLSRGVVAMPAINVAFADRGKGVEVTAFAVQLAAEAMRVAYLPPLPTVEEASATGTLDQQKLAITILSGTSAGIGVDGGTVVIADFDKPVETIAIDMRLSGPLRSATEIIGRQPLAYTEGIGLNPDQVSGTMAMRLQMGFPLLAELPMARINLLIDAELFGAAIVPGIFGIAVRDGNMRLRVDSDDLRMEGPVTLAEVPGQLIWQENFGPSAKILTQVDFHAIDVNREQIEHASRGISVSRVLKDGTVDADLTFVRSAKPPFRLDVAVDLTDASLAIAELGWQKPTGARSVLRAEAKFNEERLISIDRVSAYGAGLVLDGALSFDRKSEIESIEVSRLIAGRTEVAATVAPTSGGWEINIHGPSLDVEPAIAVLTKGDGAAERPQKGKTPSLWFAADLDRVWIASDRSFTDVVGTAVREGPLWSLLQLEATGADGSCLTATLTPGEGATRELAIHSDNAGETLRSLNLFDTMRGGALSLTGRLDDSKGDPSFSGLVRVRNYSLVRAPVLARLLSILALTGIADALSGAGISFSTLRVPFTYDRETITLDGGEAHGPSLGITASGTVSLSSDTADVRGTIVPFYFINSALGRLPLIGDLFTGGERGGGLLAASFTVRGALDDPDVSVNPLSVFAPGILREIFIFIEDQFMPPSAPAFE